MTIKNKSGIDKNKLLVAGMILKILANILTVEEALKSFPNNTNNPSIIASWHALIHYDADEELRAKHPDYREEQDSYLEMIANTLNEGKELPLNIIKSYNKFYGNVQLKRSKTFFDKIKSIFRFTI